MQHIIITKSSVIAVSRRFTREFDSAITGSATYQNGLGYRSRTQTLKLTLTLILKVTIMYAVQNNTEIKFNIVLYI